MVGDMDKSIFFIAHWFGFIGGVVSTGFVICLSKLGIYDKILLGMCVLLAVYNWGVLQRERAWIESQNIIDDRIN